MRVLDAFAECLRKGDCRRGLPSVRGASSELSRAVEAIRDSRLLIDCDLELPLQMLDLANRYHAIGDALEECGRLLRTLEIQCYWGDYAL